MRTAFSKWTRWVDRTTLTQLAWPGVYIIALSDKKMSGIPFSWCADIVYVGMTNTRGGLKSRLQQFDNTIRGRGMVVVVVYVISIQITKGFPHACMSPSVRGNAMSSRTVRPIFASWVAWRSTSMNASPLS